MTSAELNKSLTKYRKSLSVAGEAMTAFGVWTGVKVVLSLFFNQNELKEILSNPAIAEIPLWFQIVFIALSVTLILGFFLSFHLIIGLGAYKEGHGKKKGIFYLFLTVLTIIVIGIEVIVFFINPRVREGYTLLTGISSILFELTMMCICIDILYSAFMARRVEKQMHTAEAST